MYNSGFCYRNFWGFNPNKHYCEVWIITDEKSTPESFIASNISDILASDQIILETIIGGREQKTPDKLRKVILVLSSSSKEALQNLPGKNITNIINEIDKIVATIEPSNVYRIGPFENSNSHRLYAYPFFNLDMKDTDAVSNDDPDKWGVPLTAGQYYVLVKALASKYSDMGMEVIIDAFSEYVYPKGTPIAVLSNLGVDVTNFRNLNALLANVELFSLFFDILKSNSQCWLKKIHIDKLAMEFITTRGNPDDQKKSSLINEINLNERTFLIAFEFTSTVFRTNYPDNDLARYPLVIMGYIRGLMQYAGVATPLVDAIGIDNISIARITKKSPNYNDPFIVIAYGEKP